MEDYRNQFDFDQGYSADVEAELEKERQLQNELDTKTAEEEFKEFYPDQAGPVTRQDAIDSFGGSSDAPVEPVRGEDEHPFEYGRRYADWRKAYKDWEIQRDREIVKNTDPKDYTWWHNLVELDGAVEAGVGTAIEGMLTAPERLGDALQGVDIGDPNYKTEWDPMSEWDTPMQKTWWSGLIESTAHYGTYGIGLVTLGRGFVRNGLGAIGTGMTSAALAALLSERHDSHNASGELVKKIPELEPLFGPLATKDTDHPILKKFKNVMEEMAMVGLLDTVMAKIFGREGVEKALARHANVDEQVREKGRMELDAAIERITVRDITDVKALPAAGQTGRVPFRAHMNKPIADPWQGSPNSTNTPFDIHDQLNKIDTDNTASKGSTDSPLTPAQAERMANENGMSEKVMRDKAKELLGDVRYQNLVDEARKQRRSPEEVFAPAYERFMTMMGRNVYGMSPEEYWKPINDMLSARSGGEYSVDFWAMENVVTADLVNSALFKQLRDLSIGVREMKDVIDVFDVDGPMKTIADRLVIGLANVKKSRYMWSNMGVELQRPGGRTSKAMAEARKAAFDEIEESTRNSVNMAIQFMGKSGNEKIFDGIVEAMSMANKIENWMDLDKFFRKHSSGFTNQNIVLRELAGVWTNSILSGVLTGTKALLGTGQVAVLKPMARALGSLPGAVRSGNYAQTRSHLASLHAYTTLLPEAYEVFRTRLDAYWSGDFKAMRTRYSDTFNKDTHWEAWERWVELRGTAGDKAAFATAWAARKLNDNRLFSYSSRLMASYDDTFQFLQARARARQKATMHVLEQQQFDKNRGLIYDVSPEEIQKAEKEFYRNLLDSEGNIDLSKDPFALKEFQEATLTEELKGFNRGLDKLMTEYPLTKAFYNFARTGINGLNNTMKNTPVLGMLQTKHRRILLANKNDLSSVAEYGINNVDDLMAARHEVLGKQAISITVTAMGAQKYMAGELTGNGPVDRVERENWIRAGWRPRSVKIGGVWISYESLEPYSLILSTLADIGDNADLMGDTWTAESFRKWGLAVGGAVTSKSYLQGINQIVDMMAGKPGSLGRFAGNTLNNIVPMSSARNSFGRVVTPYMRELSDDIGENIRNRNLYAEQFRGDDALPIQYDIMNGEPLANWPFWQRALNAVLPIGLSIDRMTPGRELFLSSGFDRKTSVYFSPDGNDLTQSPNIRSKFMRQIGSTKIDGKNLEQALDALAEEPVVKRSMQAMKQDMAGADPNIDESEAYPHLTLIQGVLNQYRNKAWAELKEDSTVQELINKEQETLRNSNERNRQIRKNDLSQIQEVISINNYS